VLRLYDTALKAVTEIEPSDGHTLKIYACGPTVYRTAHVGNLRTFLLTDLIVRAAELADFETLVVQNITDVGHMLNDSQDKLLQQANLEGKSALEIAAYYEDIYHKDLELLNIIPADKYPHASESIELMQKLISILIEKGFAYVGKDGSVYFAAQQFSEYGELSGNRLENLKPGHRFDGAVDENKNFHADWALWKIAPESRSELVWDSPWGVGFPGWHVECSAMSLHHLGSVVDVHTGGIDLRFPHHEDERAQSNAATDLDVVKHWIHGEHLLFEGRKMAKSTGNVVLLSDVIEKGFDPLALRLAFMQTRYRTQMDLSWDTIKAAHLQIQKWRTKAQLATEAGFPIEHETAFKDLILDDLDTPRAIQLIRDTEKVLKEGAFGDFLIWADLFLGLDLDRAPTKVDVPDEVLNLIAARDDARKNKDWAASDDLRNQINEYGFAVNDTPDGTEVAPL
jgi:cysteinyl-tRNA synthetase